MTERSKMHVVCRACGEPLRGVVLDLGMQPLANNLCSEGDHHDERFPLRVVRCDRCGLLQLDTVVDPSLMFSHYLYKPGQSRKTVSHFEEMAEVATSRFGDASGSLDTPYLAVDVGSNDGTLLRALARRGWRVAGIDPAENLAAEATAAGVPTLPRFFDADAVRETLLEYGRASLVTACNVFAHTPDWIGFARCADALLAPGGLLAIEFPYGPVMLSDGTLDLIYHEHASYPSVGALDKLFSRVGMRVVDVEFLDGIHGGSVRAWVARDGEAEVRPSVSDFVDAERVRYSEGAAIHFATRAYVARERLREVVGRLRGEGRRIVGFTAPAKAVTLLEFCEIGALDVSHVVDDNPLKQGKMLPGSHIPIASPTAAPAADRQPVEPGDAVVVFAWNVVEDILPRLPRGVSVVVPMPSVRVMEI